MLVQLVDVGTQHLHHLPLQRRHNTIEVNGKLCIGGFKVRCDQLLFPHFSKLGDSELFAGLDYVKDITDTFTIDVSNRAGKFDVRPFKHLLEAVEFGRFVSDKAFAVTNKLPQLALCLIGYIARL